MEVLIRGDDLFVPFNSVQKLCRKNKSDYDIDTIITGNKNSAQLCLFKGTIQLKGPFSQFIQL